MSENDGFVKLVCNVAYNSIFSFHVRFYEIYYRKASILL